MRKKGYLFNRVGKPHGSIPGRLERDAELRISVAEDIEKNRGCITSKRCHPASAGLCGGVWKGHETADERMKFLAGSERAEVAALPPGIFPYP